MKITSYHLLPEDRRGADTCRPLEIDLYEWFRRNGSKREDPLVKSLWYTPENRDDAKTPQQRRLHPTRYHGLNLHSYWYRGTIEFRYYPSVLEQPEELMQWIIFTQFLVEWGAGRRPELDYVSRPNKWLNTLYKIYLGDRHDGPHPISRGTGRNRRLTYDHLWIANPRFLDAIEEGGG